MNRHSASTPQKRKILFKILQGKKLQQHLATPQLTTEMTFGFFSFLKQRCYQHCCQHQRRGPPCHRSAGARAQPYRHSTQGPQRGLRSDERAAVLRHVHLINPTQQSSFCNAKEEKKKKKKIRFMVSEAAAVGAAGNGLCLLRGAAAELPSQGPFALEGNAHLRTAP